MGRRRVLAVGAGLGTTAIAGCAGMDEEGFPVGSDDDTGTAGSSGRFRLLISDQPNAIGDFAELNVSFDQARVFRGEGVGDADDAVENDSDDPPDNSTTGNGNDATNSSNDGDDGENTTDPGQTDDNGLDDDEDDADAQRGFVEIDLDGATVDLTEVIGETAIEVADVELETGRYSSIQLAVTDVEGLPSEEFEADGGPGGDRGGGRRADGNHTSSENTTTETDDDDVAIQELPVNVPSDRLRIVRPFEIVEDEEVAFVFDINVVRRGDGQYNLLPVIGKSGIAGEDVDVEEVGDGADQSDDTASDDGDDNAGSDAS